MTSQFSVHSRLVVYYSLAAFFLLASVVTLLYWAMASEAALHVSWASFVSHERRVFAVVFAAGMLVALLLGFYVTGRGLLGLDHLTQTMEDISTSSLDVRLDIRAMPKELRKLAKTFNQMLARIEGAFARLKQFSDDMAHELRTPLTRLQLQTEVLLSGQLDELEWREVLATNLEVLQQMSAMIDSMLFLARADSAQVTIEKKSINVLDEVHKITEFYEALAEERQISLSLEGQATVHANPLMFGRLMNNVIANALKYTSSGGCVSVVAEHMAGGEVSILVHDNGEGIDPVHLPKLFDRFYRADASRSNAQPGTGLGLAIAKSIMDLHGGKIDINSVPGEGTVVRMVFPG